MIRVFGPRGKLTRKFNQAIDITKGTITTKDGKTCPGIKLEIWFGRKKDLASVKTLTSHINNMFIGVTKVSMLIFEPPHECVITHKIPMRVHSCAF